MLNNNKPKSPLDLEFDSLLRHWKLVNKVPVRCGLMEWAEFFGKKERHIKATQLPGVWISTIFLGIDHRLGGSSEGKRPILFESMIFGGHHNDEQWRYETYQEAEQGHEELCEMAEKTIQKESAKIVIGILIALIVWLIFD